MRSIADSEENQTDEDREYREEYKDDVIIYVIPHYLYYDIIVVWM